jgi:hypothetical protein
LKQSWIAERESDESSETRRRLVESICRGVAYVLLRARVAKSSMANLHPGKTAADQAGKTVCSKDATGTKDAVGEALGPKNSPLKRTELEDSLNDGKPFVLLSEDDWSVTTSWTDPNSGATFTLRFSDGEWRGYGLTNGRKVPALARSSFDNVTETARSLFASGLVLAAGRTRPLLSQVVLGIAIVWFAARLVKPNWVLSLKGVMSNDALFLGGVMLVMSATVVGWDYRLRRRLQSQAGQIPCPSCEYNLFGNVSGICPECGNAISQDLQARIEAG